MSSIDTNQFNSFCWNISNRCNMACKFCFRELNEEELPLEDNLAILKRIKEEGLLGNKIDKITFAGGEPLNYYGIKELIKNAYLLGFNCSLVTNGYLLNENNIDEILPYLSSITFSCDSTNEYYNAEIGRENVEYLLDGEGFESAKHIFDLIPYIRSKYNEDQLKININTLVLKDVNRTYQNIDCVCNDIYTNLSKYKINKWKLLRFYALRGAAIQNKKMFEVPDDDFERIKDYYYSLSGDIMDVSIRDYKDIDNNLIISPNGLVKMSSNGTETVYDDLKVSRTQGGGRHV